MKRFTLALVKNPVTLIVVAIAALIAAMIALYNSSEEFRALFVPLIEQVNEDRTPIEITSRRGDAVLMSRADYDALEETAHLLRVPANARHLLESLQQARSGQRDEHDLVR